MSSVLTVIPARGNSERLPNKNLSLLGGRSLIEITTEIAHQLPGDAVISSDNIDILDEAYAHGIIVPFKRPSWLAERGSQSTDVWKHALLESEKYFNKEFDYTILLEPTCPLRTLLDVEETLSAATLWGGACTVSKVKTPPQKFFQIPADGMVHFDYSVTTSQAYPQFYYRNGAAYASNRDHLLDGFKSAYPVVIDRPLISIDTQFDLDLCEWIMQNDTV